jgi:hypothetical protein
MMHRENILGNRILELPPWSTASLSVGTEIPQVCKP